MPGPDYYRALCLWGRKCSGSYHPLPGLSKSHTQHGIYFNNPLLLSCIFLWYRPFVWTIFFSKINSVSPWFCSYLYLIFKALPSLLSPIHQKYVLMLKKKWPKCPSVNLESVGCQFISWVRVSRHSGQRPHPQSFFSVKSTSGTFWTNREPRKLIPNGG